MCCFGSCITAAGVVLHVVWMLWFIVGLCVCMYMPLMCVCACVSLCVTVLLHFYLITAIVCTERKFANTPKMRFVLLATSVLITAWEQWKQASNSIIICISSTVVGTTEIRHQMQIMQLVSDLVLYLLVSESQCKRRCGCIYILPPHPAALYHQSVSGKRWGDSFGDMPRCMVW